MRVCVCVCLCEFVCVCVCMCVLYVCVCVLSLSDTGMGVWSRQEGLACSGSFQKRPRMRPRNETPHQEAPEANEVPKETKVTKETGGDAANVCHTRAHCVSRATEVRI